MIRTSTRNEPSGYPEYAVNAEVIRRFFDPPLASSTFYDLVNKGKVTPLPGLRGFYKLNDSLRRLGLREVAKPPQEGPKRSTEDIIRLGFHLIDPGVFTAPTWLLLAEVIDAADYHHAEQVAARHSAQVAELDHDQLKANYLQGVLDITAITEADGEVAAG
jgi:hypothetical protein